MSLIREDSVHISRKLRKRLWLIARATAPVPEPNARGAEGGSRKVTADEVAEKLLTEVIEQRFPQIAECEKAIEAAEENFRKAVVAAGEAAAPAP
jgi:Mg2+ and Co2+ transporter CorA